EARQSEDNGDDGPDQPAHQGRAVFARCRQPQLRVTAQQGRQRREYRGQSECYRRHRIAPTSSPAAADTPTAFHGFSWTYSSVACAARRVPSTATSRRSRVADFTLSMDDSTLARTRAM